MSDLLRHFIVRRISHCNITDSIHDKSPYHTVHQHELTETIVMQPFYFVQAKATSTHSTEEIEFMLSPLSRHYLCYDHF